MGADAVPFGYADGRADFAAISRTHAGPIIGK
mgnify:CR=1 FL=1